MKNITFYLSGPIDKNTGQINGLFHSLGKALSELGASVLTPEIRPDDISDPSAVFCRDLAQCVLADIIVVDARSSCGLGVGAELIAGLCSNAKVSIICPQDTHYRRKSVHILGADVQDWTHPFIVGFGRDQILDTEDVDVIVRNLGELCELELQVNLLPKYLDSVFLEYFQNYFNKDEYTKKIVSSNKRLKEKLNFYLGIEK